MTLQELIDEIREKYPNTLSDASIVRKMNDLQKRIFRQVRVTKGSHAPLIANQGLYSTSLRPNDILDVLVNGVSVPYRHLYEIPLAKYWFYSDGKIGIVPVPDADGQLQVFHYKTPAELSIEALDQKPETDEVYHMALVYGVCKEVAENFHDFDMANGFMMQYQSMMESMMLDHRPAMPATIREEW